MSYRKNLWTVSEGTNTAPTYQKDKLLRPTVLAGARVVRRSRATFGFGKCLIFYNGFWAKIARASSRTKRRSAKVNVSRLRGPHFTWQSQPVLDVAGT